MREDLWLWCFLRLLQESLLLPLGRREQDWESKEVEELVSEADGEYEESDDSEDEEDDEDLDEAEDDEVDEDEVDERRRHCLRPCFLLSSGCTSSAVARVSFLDLFLSFVSFLRFLSFFSVLDFSAADGGGKGGGALPLPSSTRAEHEARSLVLLGDLEMANRLENCCGDSPEG